jgi:hypothetical protein
VKIKNVKKDGWNSGLYIGRKNGQRFHFGNPFTVERYGRENCIAMFEKWLRKEDFLDIEIERRDWILANLGQLENKDLLCWCNPAPCHADVYFRLIKERQPDRS